MSHRIKVLHVVLGLGYGGTEKIIVDVANGLAPDEFQSSILCFDNNAPRAKELKRGVMLYYLNRKHGIYLSNYLLFYKKIKSINPDIIHFRNFTTYFWGIVAARLIKNCRVVYSDHGDIVLNYETNERGKLFLRKIYKYITNNFMTNSRAFKEKLIEYSNISPDRIALIRNGVDTDQYAPLAAHEVESIRSRYGFSEKDCLLGIIAGLRPKKNISLAVRIMNEMLQSVPNIKLVLVGQGEEGEKLRLLVEDLGLVDKVIFLGELKEVNEILNILDIFLFTSSFGEGMPNAVLEAMAVKIPVVASDIPGNKEILGNNERGILFKNNNAESLMQAVIEMINDEKFRTKVTESAYEYIQNEMRVDKMIKRYENFYRAVYNREKTPDIL